MNVRAPNGFFEMIEARKGCDVSGIRTSDDPARLATNVHCATCGKRVHQIEYARMLDVNHVAVKWAPEVARSLAQHQTGRLVR